MALIRKVARHENSLQWAYIEYSDENPTESIQILGGKEFPTQQEAIDYSKGFAPESYEWIEPAEIHKERLMKEKERLLSRVVEINKEMQEYLFDE